MIETFRRFSGSTLAVMGVVLALAQPVRAEGVMSSIGDGLAVTYDLVILRPLNTVALALGAGFFTLSAPLVAPFGGREGIATAWDVFIAAPYEYTVVRDLGDF
jgi:hypothetical protein